MAPIAKEQDTLSAALAGVGVTAPAAGKPQPAAVEIPVTVNGARTVEGSDKREPFSENTQTVLVFANGAVIRLASAVASGQLLFLTNDRTKKEVVCQVVKSKNYNRENGYVELEFTESSPGFWGMRFPTAGVVAAAPVAAKLAAPVSTLPEKPLPEKPVEEQAKLRPVQVAEPSKTAEVKPVKVAERPKEPEVTPVVTAPVSTATPVVAPPVSSLHERLIEATTKAEILPRAENPKQAGFRATSPAEPSEGPAKLPTLSEFLTQGTKGPELRPAETQKTTTSEQNAKENAKPQTEAAAAPQAQLTALIFQKKPEAPATEKKQNAENDSNAGQLTKMLVPDVNVAPAKANPAPGASTFDFGAEEVKIPAWLEPLARNSPASAAVFETKAPEIKTSEASYGATFAGSTESREPKEHATASTEIETETSEKGEAVLTLSSEGPTPNFGSSLAFDLNAAQKASGQGGSRKGLVLGLVAAGLLVAAGGGWYWYTNLPQNVSASGTAAPEEISGTRATPSAAPTTQPAVQPSSNVATNAASAASNRNPTNSAMAKVDSNESTSGSQHATEHADTRPEPAVKPTLGKVHLAAPVVHHAAKSTDNGAADAAPTLNENGVVRGDPASLGLLGSKGKQPVAPLPVGGDVKQARLISSVPPVYPQLAKSQRLSGDVTVDALIDVHGNVSTMKVLSGPAMLHQATMDALRQWKYQPATLNGQAMAMHLTVTVQFKLQ
jgi:TonB family protein